MTNALIVVKFKSMQKRFLVLGFSALVLALILSFGSATVTQSATTQIKSIIGTSASTWRGNITSICNAGKGTKSKAITIKFRPTSKSEGTWVSSNIDMVSGRGLCSTKLVSGATEYDLVGEYSGSYKIVGNMLLAWNVAIPDPDYSLKGKYTVLGEYDNGNLYFYGTADSPAFSVVVTK